MRKKVIAVLLVICLIMSVIVSCSKSESAENTTAEGKASEKASAAAAENENATITFTDSAGREVEVPKKITRIAPSGTMAQIVLFALAPDMFVGLSSKWDSNAEQYLSAQYYNLPVLGQFYGKGNLNLEEVAKADPQIIIDIGDSKPTIIEDMDNIMKQVGIPTIHVQATTDTMAEAYRMLGKLLGREKEAEILAQYCEEVKTKTQDIMKRVGESGKAGLLYCTGEDGLNVLAKGSFHAEIIDQVSNNLAVVKDISSKGTGNPVDMEQIVLWNPEVIIFAPDSIYDKTAQDKAWQELAAIKNGRCYEVPIGPYNWMGNPPSVNRYMGMIWITQLLYPEQAQYNVYDEAARYYKLFYHCQLTEDQYKALVANSLLAVKK